MSTDDDTQPSAMPAQPKTTQLPAANPVEIAIAQLTRSVEIGFREMRVDMQLVTNDLGIVKERVGAIETWRNAQDERATQTSMGVRGLKSVDARHEEQLAELASKVDGITSSQELQLAILGRLDKVASNPTVKVIAGMLATALITWLATHGGSLK